MYVVLTKLFHYPEKFLFFKILHNFSQTFNVTLNFLELITQTLTFLKTLINQDNKLYKYVSYFIILKSFYSIKK